MSPPLKIYSKAPTRIDLAGGTVDIWPLYLFLNNPVTINVAIDLFAETTLTSSEGEGSKAGVILISKDQNQTLQFSWEELLSAHVPPHLLLHQKLLNFFLEKKKKNGSFSSKSFLTLETSAGSPAGAGLGGSSSLGVSLIGALATWARSSAIDTITEGEALTDIIRDIETTVISVPAGLQDYYGAMFGGLQALRWAPARHDRKWLDRSILPELQERLLLFYSGQSRNSGINNWELFKSFIDQKDQVRERFQKISDSANLLESALKNRDWTKVGLAIQSEWNIRKTLAPGISTPLMEEAFNLATQNGATAMKVCGAGGGGCFFAYLPDLNSEKRSAIVKAVESLGVKSLPFNFVGNGLSIQN